MIPYDLDPSLHSEPNEPKLDDGFSRPEPGEAQRPQARDEDPPQARIGDKSDF